MMTTLTSFRTCVAAAVLVLGVSASGAASSNDATEKPIALQVRVNVPPSWRPWLEDETAEAFVAQVRDVFRQQGLEGRIEEVNELDEPDAAVPLLTINLIDWRVSHIGNIECTFTASLQTPRRGTRQFGIYTHTEMKWLHGPGRFGLADSFASAAEGALRQLGRDVAAAEMLPGLRR